MAAAASRDRYDHIVVGAGTAGSIVAARLSEDRDRRVLLIEAGCDYPDGMPPELHDASAAVLSGHNWDLQGILDEESGPGAGEERRIARMFEIASRHLGSEYRPGRAAVVDRSGPRMQYPLGKVVGGGSAVNGGLALHGRREDYAAWVSAGNPAWSWERVRPYMERIERAEQHKPALPIETATELTRCQEAFLDTCRAMELPCVDLRQGTAAGVGTLPRSVRHGRRVSTSTLYLAAARRRSNLTIQPTCLVDRLIVERRGASHAATGVEAVIDGRRSRFFGGQITLCAGAVNSPAILLRSGIGASGEIARAGATPLVDLPAVGRNLQDHPAVSLWAVPKPGACALGETVHQLMLQRRSSASDALCDLQLFMLSAVPTRRFPMLAETLDSDVALGISVVVATPQSRGRVEIVDAQPTTAPRIYLNCLRESADARRMIEGVRVAWRLLQGDPLARRVARLAVWTPSAIDSDATLERIMRSTVRATWHPVGTLRMGAEGDPAAAVDECGRVYGCRNLTVADASIVPAIPSVPTALTCMLIGERVAAMLRGEEAAQAPRSH